MRTRREIVKRIAELKPEFERAEEAYFSAIEEKQEGGEIYHADFLKLESDYEILKKEIETLQWVVYTDSGENEKEQEDENSFSHKEG
jgi:hypothetical protein